MVEQLSPIPSLPERNPNMIDPGAIPQAPAPGAPEAAPAPASGAPAPEAASAEPLPAGFQMQPLVAPDDPRYKDTRWTLVTDAILAGATPWIMATLDVAFGNASEEDFEDIRQSHQLRIQAMKEDNPEIVQAVEQAIPFLAGLGIGGIGGKAKGIASNIKQGAGAGALYGGVQGYTEDVEAPTLSGERVAEGLGKGAVDAVVGAAGGAAGSVPGIRGRAKDAKDAQDAQELSERSAGAKKYFADKKRRETAAIKKYEKEEQATAEQKKKDTEAAAAQKKKEAEDAKLLRQQNDELFEKYSKKPNKPDKHWAGNMSEFIKNPRDVFRQAAAQSPNLTDLARSVNMSPIAIAKVIETRARGLKTETASEKKLLEQINNAWNAAQAIKARGGN